MGKFQYLAKQDHSYISGGDEPRLPSFDLGQVFFPDVPRRTLSLRDDPAPRWLLGIELAELVDSDGELDNCARLSRSAAVSPSVKLKDVADVIKMGTIEKNLPPPQNSPQIVKYCNLHLSYFNPTLT